MQHHQHYASQINIQQPPPPAADIVQVLDLSPQEQHDPNPPHRPPPQDSDDIEVLQTCWRTEMQRLGIGASLL